LNARVSRTLTVTEAGSIVTEAAVSGGLGLGVGEGVGVGVASGETVGVGVGAVTGEGVAVGVGAGLLFDPPLPPHPARHSVPRAATAKMLRRGQMGIVTR
jgi:hypothetical protein